MKISEIESKIVNEKIYQVEYDSGLRAYLLPKKGFSKQFVVFAANYGSIDNKFKDSEDDDFTEVPDGIAHFLEHKLFEQEDGNAFEKFSRLGSSPNAYTNYTTTAYLFASTDNFMENFKILLDFVQKPHLTDENVEKEKGIIAQEIKMYEDDPDAKVFKNLMECLYTNNPINKDIAGTIESINKIDKNILYKCYNTFYRPANMVIFAGGDIDIKAVSSIIEEKVNKPYRGEIKREFPNEPEGIKQDYIESKLSVSLPIFNLGFKDSRTGLKGKELLKRILCSNILLDMIFGRSSDFYNRLYEQGLINNGFGSNFIAEERYCFTLMGGESKDPNGVRHAVVDEINKMANNGLNKNTFERLKKLHIGRMLRQFDDIEGTAHAFINFIFNDIMIFDYIEMLKVLSFHDVSQRFAEMLNTKKMAISIINPI